MQHNDKAVRRGAQCSLCPNEHIVMCDLENEMNYEKVPTSREVWTAIKAAHPELVVFSSYSAPDGDQFGNPDVCKMMTEYGFPQCDMPIIGAETTWDRDTDHGNVRTGENTEYWLCVAICGEDNK